MIGEQYIGKDVNEWKRSSPTLKHYASICLGIICSESFFRLNSASKVYQVKEIAKGTNPSVNNKRQAIEIRKGNNSMLKINKK
jgi:hypothetical protein